MWDSRLSLQRTSTACTVEACIPSLPAILHRTEAVAPPQPHDPHHLGAAAGVWDGVSCLHKVTQLVTHLLGLTLCGEGRTHELVPMAHGAKPATAVPAAAVFAASRLRRGRNCRRTLQSQGRGQRRKPQRQCASGVAWVPPEYTPSDDGSLPSETVRKCDPLRGASVALVTRDVKPRTKCFGRQEEVRGSAGNRALHHSQISVVGRAWC